MNGTIRVNELKNLYASLSIMGIDPTLLRLSDPRPTENDWAVEELDWSLKS